MNYGLGAVLYLFWDGFSGVQSVTPADRCEYTIPAQRMEYTMPAQRMEYTVTR